LTRLTFKYRDRNDKELIDHECKDSEDLCVKVMFQPYKAHFREPQKTARNFHNRPVKEVRGSWSTEERERSLRGKQNCLEMAALSP